MRAHHAPAHVDAHDALATCRDDVAEARAVIAPGGSDYVP
ncbi:Hypothetical protein A7982_11440 [Minicystis rosea]|nr:Hypothetical protein A7982_11440 [Minicystis rosea]